MVAKLRCSCGPCARKARRLPAESKGARETARRSAALRIFVLFSIFRQQAYPPSFFPLRSLLSNTEGVYIKKASRWRGFVSGPFSCASAPDGSWHFHFSSKTVYLFTLLFIWPTCTSSVAWVRLRAGRRSDVRLDSENQPGS